MNEISNHYDGSYVNKNSLIRFEGKLKKDRIKGYSSIKDFLLKNK